MGSIKLENCSSKFNIINCLCLVGIVFLCLQNYYEDKDYAEPTLINTGNTIDTIAKPVYVYHMEEPDSNKGFTTTDTYTKYVIVYEFTVDDIVNQFTIDTKYSNYPNEIEVKYKVDNPKEYFYNKGFVNDLVGHDQWIHVKE